MGFYMGRDSVGGSDVTSKAPSNNTVELLEETFENALRGDEKALEVLLTLIKSRYGNLILSRLRHHRGRSRTATIEDVFQQSLLDLMEQVKAGALSDLKDTERRDVVGYFQVLCDRKLENLKKARLDPLYSPHKEVLPEHVRKDKRVGEEAFIPGDERKTEQLLRHQRLLHEAIGTLDPADRNILDRYLAGVPYSELSTETGIKVSTLESLVTRIKQRLAERILDQSPTARIHHGLDETPTRSKSLAPTAEEVREAIEELPLDIQEAIRFVHLKAGSVEKLAKKLGDRGLEKAQARLKRGYDSLSIKLDLPFPDSFSLLKDE